MTKLIVLVMLAPSLGGCWISDRDPAAVLGAGYYSRSEIDAINAEAQCKAVARTLVQIARCEMRR